MEANFTLIPVGGLGNRINAICSAITYCVSRNKTLRIIWHKESGLNCSYKDLFYINPMVKNVEIREPTFSDYCFRSVYFPKWLSRFYNRLLFDKRIYWKEVIEVVVDHKKTDFGDIDKYKHIYMISFWRFWESKDMWKYIIPNPEILEKVEVVLNKIPTQRIIGIHIRRTDNLYSIQDSPTELFIDKIKEEIDIYKDDVSFYLASDSLEEKRNLKELFGDRIITDMKETSRNTKEGMIDAFVELNILAKTNKIYASAKSSFSELAHFLGENEWEILMSPALSAISDN